MKRFLKICLGIFSILPLLSCIYIAVKLILDKDFVTMLQIGGPEHFQKFLITIAIIQIVTIILLIGYIVNVFVNKKVINKVLWSILIFFGSIITIPIYWYLYLWRLPLEKTITENKY